MRLTNSANNVKYAQASKIYSRFKKEEDKEKDVNVKRVKKKVEWLLPIPQNYDKINWVNWENERNSLSPDIKAQQIKGKNKIHK